MKTHILEFVVKKPKKVRKLRSFFSATKLAQVVRSCNLGHKLLVVF